MLGARVMAVTETRAAGVQVIPDRDRVRLIVGAGLDRRLLGDLEDEARDLLDRGFSEVVIDLRAVMSAPPETAAAVAAIDRRARACGGRVSLLIAESGAIRALAEAGLIGDLADAGESIYFDWSR